MAANPDTLISELKGYDFENINYKLLDKVKLRIDYYLGNKHGSSKWVSDDKVVEALGTYLIKWHQAGDCIRQIDPDKYKVVKVVPMPPPV